MVMLLNIFHMEKVKFMPLIQTWKWIQRIVETKRQMSSESRDCGLQRVKTRRRRKVLLTVLAMPWLCTLHIDSFDLLNLLFSNNYSVHTISSFLFYTLLNSLPYSFIPSLSFFWIHFMVNLLISIVNPGIWRVSGHECECVTSYHWVLTIL